MDLLHNRRTPFFFALVLGLTLGTTVGCNEKGGKTSETKVKQGEVVATVNGETITEGELNDYRSARPDSAGQNDEALLDELVTQKVIYQDALRKNLEKDPEVLRELEQMRIRVLVSAAVRKTITDTQITDEELQAEYDQLKERMVSTEYKASHILVKEEEQARNIIEKIKKGEDFAKLAKEHSIDPSGQNGGDLGWFNPQQMVPPFSQAVGQLEKGSYTSEPVKTQFGWHVIKLEDKRQSEPPALEEIKGRLVQMLKQRQIRDYIQSLKDQAKISINKKADTSTAEKHEGATPEKQGESADK